MAPPKTLVGVAGTGTEVGKTWTTAALARELRARGVSVSARKPVQSFAADDPEETRDAAVLAAATGESAEDVCPPGRSYAVPMAPPMAASALGRPPITLADLVAEIAWPAIDVDVGFVETVGGVSSPIAEDGDSAALVSAIAADFVILVADAGLGTINLVRLSMTALDHPRVMVFLNRYQDDDDLHRRNRSWLTDRDGFNLATRVEELVAWCS